MDQLLTGSAIDRELNLGAYWTNDMWRVGLLTEQGWRGRTQPLFRQADAEDILAWPNLDDGPHPEALRVRISAQNWDKSVSTLKNAEKFRGWWEVRYPENYEWLLLSCRTVTVAVFKITGFETDRGQRRFSVEASPEAIQRAFIHKTVESPRGSDTLHVPEVK